jgi:hypothetical protein
MSIRRNELMMYIQEALIAGQEVAEGFLAVLKIQVGDVGGDQGMGECKSAVQVELPSGARQGLR